MKTIFHRGFGLLIAGTSLMAPAVAGRAQTVAPATSTVWQTPATPAQISAPEKTQPRRPPRRATTLPATVTVVADQARVAPQVVTIVHRLSGVKMLRLLLRQGEQPDTIYTIDPDAITSDAHASIIAGWALDDGKTIAVRLPQAGAELEFAEFPDLRAGFEAQSPTVSASRMRLSAMTQPDLTVITRDGRKLRARYVGLDGQTGLSVLQVTSLVMPPLTAQIAKELLQGQGVQIFAPERIMSAGEASSRNIYVQVGEVETKIATLANSGGKLERLMVRGAGLSPLVIGGIACDDRGKTLGIVESIEGDNARIVPADTVRAAARRVLARQSSVPRPLLGVVGEPVEFAARNSFLAYGWNETQLPGLLQQPFGILLTSVRPGTPAALAKLSAGDVIVRVNAEYIKSSEEFSKLLGDAGSGQEVQFLVRRPSLPEPISIDVKLGGSFDSIFKYHFDFSQITPKLNGLEGLGVETMALSSKNLLQLGAENGVLVVAVEPESIAARNGLREGDVIESIDGRVLRRGVGTANVQFNRQKKHVLSLVRKREKKQVILEPVE